MTVATGVDRSSKVIAEAEYSFAVRMVDGTGVVSVYSAVLNSVEEMVTEVEGDARSSFAAEMAMEEDVDDVSVPVASLAGTDTDASSDAAGEGVGCVAEEEKTTKDVKDRVGASFAVLTKEAAWVPQLPKTGLHPVPQWTSVLPQ